MIASGTAYQAEALTLPSAASSAPADLHCDDERLEGKPERPLITSGPLPHGTLSGDIRNQGNPHETCLTVPLRSS